MEFFPFPDKTACLEELKRDKYADRIPEGDWQGILEAAWDRGESAAHDCFQQGKTDIYQVVEQANLQINRIDRDMVVGGTRYFAEIYVKTGTVNIYTPSVALWTRHNSLTERQAEELILAHEYFHYLEYTILPPAKDIYQIPILRLFGCTLMSAGLRSVSEIGAHSFTRNYYQMIMEP